MAREHQVLVIAKNTAGIGARILALFNRRGFNVTKMTSGITNTPGYARITLTVEADDRILDQIQKQIYKLIDVVKVKVTKVDDKGKINVSRKALMPKPIKKEEKKDETK